MLRRVGALLLALAFASFSPMVASHHLQPPDGGGGNGMAFEHRGGNEWWVEVSISGNAVNSVTRVDSRDDGGAWTPLAKQSWGNWAASYHIEPGHRVQFHAVWPNGDGTPFESWTSCWFTHPAGVEQCVVTPTPAGLLASTYVGPTGGALERVFDVAVDGQGNAFVAGSRFTKYADSTTADGFVRKVLPDGRTGWTTWLGGSNFDEATAVSTDAGGNVYVAGNTWSVDFPADGWRPYADGAGDAFAVKLDASGTRVWSTYLGGSGGERAEDIAASGEGTVFVGGTTWSCNYPVYGPAPQPQPGSPCGSSTADGFITKLTANGLSAVYSTFWGGSGADRILGLAAATDGTLIVAGETVSTDFPVTPGAPQATLNGWQDAFVTRFAPFATVDYSTYLGGSDAEGATSVARDASGAAYVTGTTRSKDFPTTAGAYGRAYGSGLMCTHTAGGPNPYLVEEDCPDAFVTKLASDGRSMAYSTYVATSRVEESNGIAVDAAGDAYITGRTNSTSLPKVGTQVGPGGGWLDSFAFALSPDGSRPIHSTLLGGTDGDFGESVAVMPDGTAWYAGWTWSLDFPVTASAGQPTRDGGEDGFATRFAPQTAQGGDPIINFDHRGGNEWWVEVSTGGLGAKPTQVQAMDGNTPWTALSLRSWGNWAGSFHIEPGNQVRFRGLVGGEWFDSCWFTHPAGKTPTGAETCDGVREGSPPPPGFDATFSNVKGNDWWVQANVAANQPIAAVEARVNCAGAWHPLAKQSWGGYAASFNVPAGSKVDLRARSTGGAQDLSGGYIWPNATPAAACP